MLGDSVKVRLKYVEFIALNPGGTFVPAVYDFSANGLYDPNITGSGHQPRGFDQFIVLWDHYLVEKSTCKATFAPSSTMVTNTICGILLTDSVFTITDAPIELEQRNTTSCVISFDNHSQTRYLNYNAKSFFGKRWSNDSMVGNVAGNPADQAYFRIFAQGFSSSDPGPVEVLVELEYDVILTEPRSVAAS